MYTKTITLAGAELSSFLAAGGQTVNPNTIAAAATSTPVAAGNILPTIVLQNPTTSAAQIPTVILGGGNVATSSSSSAAAVVPTSSAAVAATTSPSSTSRPILSSSSSQSSSSSSSSSAAATSSSSAAAAAAPVAAAAPAATSQAATRPAIRVTGSVTRASSSSTGVPAAQIALNNGSAKSQHLALSGGGIAGLIIGLLLAAGVLAAFLFFLAKKRKDKRNAEYAYEKSQRERRNEKGAMRLDEAAVGTGAPVGPNGSSAPGFNFGVLPAIAPAAPMTTTGDNYHRSASPADMHRGAAVLGIQRPYTPPPGHSAHPAYRQPSLGSQGPRSITPNSQHSARNFSNGPNGQNRMRNPIPPQQALRSQPVLAPVPLPVTRQTSDPQNPFNDQVAAPLARDHAPAVPLLTTTQSRPQMRGSGQSYKSGDDSPALSVSPRTETPGQLAPLLVQHITTSTIPTSHFERTRSVLQATDGWAQRKAQVKNAISSSPAPEQSPFSDPAPLIKQDISSAPLDISFNH